MGSSTVIESWRSIAALNPTDNRCENPAAYCSTLANTAHRGRAGNYLASGFGVEPKEAYPALLQQKVDAAGLPFTIVNAGVSGDTTAGGLRRLDWVLRQPADVLVLELGGNDGLRGLAPEATRSNLVAIIGKARAKNPETKVVLAGMVMPDNMGEAYNRKFQAIFPEVAQEQKVALIPFLLAGVGGLTELNQPDQIHPTAKGHALVASNVWVTLEPVLREVAVVRKLEEAK